MNCDYAFAKFQGINGNEYFLKNFPVVLLKNNKEKNGKTNIANNSIISKININTNTDTNANTNAKKEESNNIKEIDISSVE